MLRPAKQLVFETQFASVGRYLRARFHPNFASTHDVVLGQHSRFITHPILLNRFELVDAIENRIKGRTQILIVLKVYWELP